MVFDTGGVDRNELGWTGMEMEHAMAMSEDEPLLGEALKGDEREAWTDAIEAELTQMEKVNAWIPVIPPHNANIIPSRYVFHRKRNDTGKIVRYKARLVVKGFKQQFGVDYIETFAPTVRAPTLQILLYFAAQKGAAVHQCDVKNAYLNSRLRGNVTLYSELPPKYSPSVNFHQILRISQMSLANGWSQFTARSKGLMIGTPRLKPFSLITVTQSPWQMKQYSSN